VVVAAPMIAAAVANPSNYLGRAGATSVLNPGLVADAPFPIHVVRTLLMFGLFGDPNARHDVAALPLLPIPLAIVAAFGVRSLWRDRHQPAASLILLALPLFLLPPVLFPDGSSPHFLRSLGLAAPLGVTIGLGAVELAAVARRRAGNAAALAAASLVVVTLAGVAAWSGYVYLNRSVADRWDAYSYPANELAAAAAAQPDSAVILGGFDTVDVQFLDYAQRTPIYDPSEIIPNPGQYRRIFATSQYDIERVLGRAAADRAVPVAWDPEGRPAVWAVTP